MSEWQGKSTDTGWLGLTYGTGWGAGSITPQVRVKDGIVRFRGRLVRSSGTGTNMATVPTVAVPVFTYSTFTRSGSAWIGFGITTGGVLSINSAHVTGDEVIIDNQSYLST